jgi:hypothetical protein
MVVLAWFIFLVPCVIVAYWVGRAHRLNKIIEREPERVLYDTTTGEVIEPEAPEWQRAMRQGNVVSFVP